VPSDVFGVLPDPSDVLRSGRVLERQPKKVQARSGVYHASMVDRVATIVEDGQLDPAEVETEASRPHHNGHIQHPAICEPRLAAHNAFDPGHQFDAGGRDLLGLETDERGP
jgi:hypothetical protein